MRQFTHISDSQVYKMGNKIPQDHLLRLRSPYQSGILISTWLFQIVFLLLNRKKDSVSNSNQKVGGIDILLDNYVDFSEVNKIRVMECVRSAENLHCTAGGPSLITHSSTEGASTTPKHTLQCRRHPCFQGQG